jgi:hypothetical protein
MVQGFSIEVMVNAIGVDRAENGPSNIWKVLDRNDPRHLFVM